MRLLKKFTCHKITDELLQTYQDIQSHPHLYINTTFEFVAERDLKFSQIEKEFEEGTVKRRSHCYSYY